MEPEFIAPVRPDRAAAWSRDARIRNRFRNGAKKSSARRRAL